MHNFKNVSGQITTVLLFSKSNLYSKLKYIKHTDIDKRSFIVNKFKNV